MNDNRVQLKSLSHINPGFDMGPLPQNNNCITIKTSCSEDLDLKHAGGGEQIIDMNDKCYPGDEGFCQQEKSNSQIAIRIRDAVKYYQSGEPVLNNLNMTVNEGSIYTLLGSSGCGKTTLLSCIIGFQKLNGGEILVFGSPPCSKGSGVPGKLVGYMPQEISLYPSLSIQEVLEYFGTLYGMSNNEIQEKVKFLVEFLHLPAASRRIGTLSGGQKRRVSFAISLFPEPALLILDEPTVGVDPLLRESIWNHLTDLVARKKTTVIITTHYHEECVHSDRIGMIRNGRLLTEESPKNILENYSSINQFITKLCRDDSSTNLPELNTKEVKKHHNQFPTIADTHRPEVLSVQRCVRKIPPAAHTRNHLWAMIKKNTMLITRNYLFLLFLICVPAIQACLFCLAVGNDPKPLSFGILNYENNFTQCIPIPPDEDEGCQLDSLSCQFITKIPSDKVTVYNFENWDTAMDSLKMGKIWGFMQFPANFSDHFYTRATSNGQFLDNETFIGSEVQVEMDASSKQITSTLIKVFTDTFQSFSRKLLNGCGHDERAAEMPINYLPPVFGDYSAGFRQFLAPSLVLGILFFFPIISSSMQCIREKKEGTLERTVVAGVRTWEILAAYSVTESAIVLLQTALGFFIISAVFQIPIQGSVTLVVLLCMLIGLSGVSVGFLIGNFCQEETEAALLSMAVFFPNFILAGMFWPIEGLPVVLQYLAYALPCTLASESIRSIVNRSWGFDHPKVWPGFAVTFAWITTYWILNIIFHARASIRRKR